MLPEILENALKAAGITKKELSDQLLADIKTIAHCETNKAPIRFLLATLPAVVDNPSLRLSKPYHKLGERSIPGRSIDESVVQKFISMHDLPCNSTTAFLTPAFRTISSPITSKDFFKNCRPANVYEALFRIIQNVDTDPTIAYDVLTKLVAELLNVKTSQESQLQVMQEKLKAINGEDEEILSSEDIVDLLTLHLKSSTRTSRLPVLIIAAAYEAIRPPFTQKTKPLEKHNAADSQTGSLGDIEITLETSDRVITCYEMKDKEVQINDILIALHKIEKAGQKPSNYLFVTTKAIDAKVASYAKGLFIKTGVEFAVIDVLGFIRHFLHFFHSYRKSFLDSYQKLLLKDSAVTQTVKTTFLVLRQNKEEDNLTEAHH